MYETIPHNSSFEEQLAAVKSIETQNGTVNFVELRPVEPESDVPIMLLGGFGTDINSTAEAARRIVDQRRAVILLDRPPLSRVRGDAHDGISGLQWQLAEDVNQVAAASGHEKIDLAAQSEAALFATAAALEQPDLYRSLVIESGAGMVGRDNAPKLVGRFAMDALLGGRRYLQNKQESNGYRSSMVRHFRAQGVARTVAEIKSIASSRIDQALTNVRRAGVKVAVINAGSDKVFNQRKVDQHIHMNMKADDPAEADNVDLYSSVVDRGARHGSMLFDEVGIGAVLASVRQFEYDEQHAVTANQKQLATAA